MARRSITFPSQSRELTLVRQDDPVWAGYTAVRPWPPSSVWIWLCKRSSAA